MIGLDLSDALCDPLLLDTFSVTRRIETISPNGRPVTINSVKSGIFGTVCAASPTDLQRLGDYQVQGKTISIVTQYRLHGAVKSGATSYQPDVVNWNGSNFLVILVDDYSQYGAGWMQAIATSKDNVDQSPVDIYQPSAIFTSRKNSELIPLCS